MSQKVWYKKKSLWFLFFFFAWFFFSRSEILKLRYDKQKFAQTLANIHGIKPFYDFKTYKDRSIHFLKLFTSSDKPILVFVHGSPGSLSAYEDYLRDKDLLQNADLISIDRPGFGYSDFGKTAVSVEQQSNLVAEILRDFPKRKKVLVGHSMGGPIITKVAMDYPNMVDGLVEIASSVSPELEPSNTWRKFLDFFLFRWFTPPSLTVCNQEIIPLKKELIEMKSDWDKIKIPITVIQGTADPLVPAGNAYFIEKMAINCPSIKLNILEGKDHFILWSETQIIKKELIEMIKKIQ